MNTRRQKSDLLTNIENLWQDAEHSADDQAKSTFERISNLMQDAMATELVANDTDPLIHRPTALDSDHDDRLTKIAALVDDARQDNAADADATSASPPPTFEEAKARMDSVSQLKPPQEDSFKSGSPEYAFGAAFTDLVRHVVRDYIHNEVEGVIKNAIKSELDQHFKSHDKDNST